MESANGNGKVLLGTSSFSEESWVGSFYPDGTAPRDFLSYYATRFNTVEVDATYYAIPAKSTVKGWAERTPRDFVISAKFPKAIVHCGEKAKPRGDLILTKDATYKVRDLFLSTMRALGDKCGALLIQLPYLNKEAFASRGKFLERLEPFLADLPQDFRYALEIRNKSWLKDDLTALLREHNVALALVDHVWMLHGDEVIKLIDPLTTDLSYIRLVGDRKKTEALTETLERRWSREVIDQSERIDRWAAVIHTIVEKNINVLAYINNHFAGHAPATVARLQTALSKRA